MITLLALLFISFCLCSPLSWLPDEVNTLETLALEINLTVDFSPQTPVGPCGAASLWGLEECSSCPSNNEGRAGD